MLLDRWKGCCNKAQSAHTVLIIGFCWEGGIDSLFSLHPVFKQHFDSQTSWKVGVLWTAMLLTFTFIVYYYHFINNILFCRYLFHFSTADHRIHVVFRSKPKHCWPINCSLAFKTWITVIRKGYFIEALKRLMSNSQIAESFLDAAPSCVVDKLKLSPERDCNVNNKREGMLVELSFRDAKGIEPLCTQTSNQSCRDVGML